MKKKEEHFKKQFGLTISSCNDRLMNTEIIVDTGAQPSIIKDKMLLANFLSISSTLHQVDGSIKAKGKGDFIVNPEFPPLHNSIFVPHSNYNFLSVCQMSDSWSTVFTNDDFTTFRGKIQIPDKKVILKGTQTKGDSTSCKAHEPQHFVYERCPCQ